MRTFLIAFLFFALMSPIANAYTAQDKSGTIVLGGSTLQVLMAANPSRVACALQPQSGDVYINTVGSTVGPGKPSVLIPAPGRFTCPSGFQGTIMIYGATTGATFAAEEDTVP